MTNEVTKKLEWKRTTEQRKRRRFHGFLADCVTSELVQLLQSLHLLVLFIYANLVFFFFLRYANLVFTLPSLLLFARDLGEWIG